MPGRITGKLTMLLIEDSLVHQELTRRAIEAVGANVKLFVVSDGVEALDYLHHRGDYEAKDSSPRPDLILLDLNMPRMNGLELLEEIKRDPRLRMIPVNILTTSDASSDIDNSYERGANAYLVKPDGFGDFKKLLAELVNFWLERTRLPSDSPGVPHDS
jgi:CheY-like chemotaxis protein